MRRAGMRGIHFDANGFNMQTPQQMSTEELLAKATARPWAIVNNGEDVRIETEQTNICTMADGDHGDNGPDIDAELIRRAVNSFEATRSSIVEMQAALGGISAWEHESGLSTPQVNAISRAWFAQQAALTLANAK